MHVIGLDLGTSGLKGIVLDAEQRILAEAHAPLTLSRPHDGWAEQDPAAWVAALERVMDTLATRMSLAQVRAIGLSGQMHGAVFLDAAGEVLRPCILWNDSRAHAEAAALDADPQFRAVTGNIVFAGFTAPKVLWLATHEPHLRARLAKVLLPKDYLRFILTGETLSDMSDASGTAWLDPARRDWDGGLLSACGLTRAEMPALVEGSAPAGRLRPLWAARWGLGDDVILAGGAGDNAASAIGMGVVRAGEAFLSLGTSGVLFAASAGFHPDAPRAVHSFCHALPDSWHQMGVILAAGDALNWWAGTSGMSASALTGTLGPLRAPGRLMFLPYLGGERTPHNDPAIRGAFIGLDHATDRKAMTRAVLEGTAFAFRDCLDALAATGTRITRLLGVGGGTRARYWVEVLATALGLPIDLPVAGDFGAAFGAARLALMAAGQGPDIARPPPIRDTVDPVGPHSAAFAEAHARYRAAYRALRAL